MREIKHGTATAYCTHGCRCEICRASRAEAMRSRRRAGGDVYGKARARAVVEAVRRFQQEHPEEWAALIDQHKQEIIAERSTVRRTA